MNQKEIWKKYITAQSKILEHKSKPIGIDTSKAVQLDGLKLHISIDQEIFKQTFKSEVEQLFNVQNFDFNNGYIQTKIENTVELTPDKLARLKELAEICYIEFNENPVIAGFIKNKIDLEFILKSVKQYTTRDISISRLRSENSMYLTKIEREECDKISGIKFEDSVKAKIRVEPTNQTNNDSDFWEYLFKNLNSKIFKSSKKHRTISFVFDNINEFEERFKMLNTNSQINVIYNDEKQNYKYTIKYTNKLSELQSNLNKEIPNLYTKLIDNGEKLIFRQFYQTGNKTEVLARLQNQLDDYVDLDSFTCQLDKKFEEKYLCKENFKLKIEQETEKLSKLLREDFYFGNPKEKLFLGKLKNVKYPDLLFIVDEDKLEEVKENIKKETLKAIFPDLKGEKDKIKRLEDTIIKLDSKDKLPNDNAKAFLYDSSKAKGIDNIKYLLNKTSVEWQDFENNLFSKSLNESQRQAIYKSLYAEELALIQGPPGTGKSTAIAEIIWQHIRKNQREKILLTSETNLAVDNAIDRLKNRQNNIVKPIRFGNTENLESEGYYYSLEAIKDWQQNNDSQSNTVSHWLNNIVSRIINQGDEQIDSALENWKNHLQDPNTGTRNLFADKYLEYVNLIGATGSSIGKLNSENRWTSFFRSYLNVFHSLQYEASFWDKSAKSYCYGVNIGFDTIIMDEASKATPPELASPVLYGKKSIIVGDHRQLPPLIDGEEIKDILVSIGETALAKALSQKEFETSQFERLFTHIDESIKGTFDTQYRMHPAINDAIAQFYEDDGGLKCGLPLDESYHKSFEKWDSRYHGLKYGNFITPETHTVWINVATPEIQEGTSRVNFGEIEAINNILTVIKNCEGKNEYDNWLANQSQEEKQIGLISFYGKQISYLEQMLLQSHNDLYKGKGKMNDKENLIRLSTVDRFQGMERNIIIVSMVRSNKIAASKDQFPNYELYGEIGYQKQDSLGFAESYNRLNVALSRARRLLIVVGNGEHFCRKPIYKNVFETIQQNGNIISAIELQNVVEQNG